MAILAPSANFEGSSLGNNDSGRIIVPEARLIQLNKPEYKDGIYLFILPAYKLDRNGKGVWLNVIKVRDNFGLETKERFYESADSPVGYFANQAKLAFPEYTTVHTLKKDGQDRKVYPTFGRVSTRVVYNVAQTQHLELGAHIIEVPSYGCADVIDGYHHRPLRNGQLPSLVCDHLGATPVFFMLKKGGVGNPWVVNVESSEKQPLPLELADSDYLYNLDDAVIKPNNEELYEKLRVITPTDVFEQCMRGYKLPGSSQAVAFVTHAAPAEQPAAVAPAARAPIAKPMTIAKPTLTPSVASTLQSVTEAPLPREVVTSGSNPMASQQPVNLKAWMAEKKAAQEAAAAAKQ